LAIASKLILGIIAFVLIGWIGARDKRIGGVLLTFPLLNGIAMLTGVDPEGLAHTIYLVMLWNCALFLFVIRRYEALPPLPAAMNAEAKLIARVVTWMLLWAAGAAAVTSARDALSSAVVLFVVGLAAAALYVWRWWRTPPRPSSVTFGAMWLNWSGIIRIACFVAAFALLAVVAAVNQDSRWVGMASALPLPGLFALATLSVTQNKQDTLSLGDTVLLGPLLVVPFNALLAWAIVTLRHLQAGPFAELMTVVAFWVAAAGLVIGAVPRFAAWRDAVKSANSTIA
jgi:hypothetical protein